MKLAFSKDKHETISSWRSEMKKIIAIVVILIIIFVQYIPKISLDTSNMKNLETNSAIYHFQSSDEGLVEEISAVMEYKFNDINKKLVFDSQSKTNIYIYPNQKVFHRKKYGMLIDLIKIFNKLDWYVGDNIKENVLLVSPLNPGTEHTKESVIDVIPHEYVHAIIYQINPKTPLWINEGIALYLTNGKPMTGYLKNDLPTYKEIQTSNPIKFANIYGYEFAHTYIEFLDKTYGFNQIITFLKSDLSYEDSFGKTSEELYDEWLTYLSQTYTSF